MAIDDRDVSENKDDAQASQVTASNAAADARLSAKGASRRRFARVGAGATGVVMTLYSTPGMACQFCGISPSSAVSAVGQGKVPGTLSHRGPTAKCKGVGPSVWAANSRWSVCDPSDGFSTYFTCSGKTAGYANYSCGQVLAGKTNCDSSKLGMYMMAAFLNVNAGLVDFYTVQALRDIWNEISAKGVYEPMAGQSWTPSEIVYYLSNTMD